MNDCMHSIAARNTVRWYTRAAHWIDIAIATTIAENCGYHQQRVRQTRQIHHRRY
jgi:hypothetical protein